MHVMSSEWFAIQVSHKRRRAHQTPTALSMRLKPLIAQNIKTPLPAVLSMSEILQRRCRHVERTDRQLYPQI